MPNRRKSVSVSPRKEIPILGKTISPKKTPPSRKKLSPKKMSTPRKNISPKKVSTPRENLSPKKTPPSRKNVSPKEVSTPRNNLSPKEISTPRKKLSPKKTPPSRKNLSPKKVSTPQNNLSPKKMSTRRQNLSPKKVVSTPRKSRSPKKTSPPLPKAALIKSLTLRLRKTPSASGRSMPDEPEEYEVIPTPSPHLPEKRITRTSSRVRKTVEDSIGSPYDYYKHGGRRSLTFKENGATPKKVQEGTPVVVKEEKEETPPEIPKENVHNEPEDFKSTPRRSARAQSVHALRFPDTPKPVAIPTTPVQATRRSTRVVRTPVSVTKTRIDVKMTPVSVTKTPAGVAKTLAETPRPKNIFGKKAVKCPVPCREVEFEQIWNFMKSNLEASESGCIYVSGVPGTGKTLVVKAVLSALDEVAAESKSTNFKHVYINGLSLGAPQKIWNRLYQSIIGRKISLSSDKALAQLEKYFKGKHVPVILIVDELDQVLDRQQSIVYQLLEWSSNNSALFSFVAIFNTINLPEKALDMKNISRLGLDRVIFKAYTVDQIKGILQHYLGAAKTGRLGEAVTLISRKVAAVSGDARRALEIAKRALEIMDSKKISGIQAVNETFKELFSAPKIQAIECCSTLEQKILTTIANDCQNTGKDETTLNKVITHIRSTCLMEGYPWSIGQILSASARLFASRLILLENRDPTMYKKVMLNVPIEDINFVFKINNDDMDTTD